MSTHISVSNCIFESLRILYPLLLFNSEGDCAAAQLRSGNDHSADGWKPLPLPEIE
jgi:hypothetical protein